MIDQIECKHQQQSIDDDEDNDGDNESFDFNFLNDNLFFEAINLIMPRSHHELNTRKIQRSNSVPSDLNTLETKENNYKSDKCQVNVNPHSTSGIDYKILIEKINNRVYTCLARACGVEFTHKHDLIEHLKSIHKIEYEDYTDSILKIHSIQTYKCLLKRDHTNAICGKKLDTISKITNHILRDHKSSEVIRPEYNNLEFRFLFDHLHELHVCSYENCMRLFINKTCYRKHKQLSHFNLKSSFDLSQTSTTKHICDICGVKFTRPSHLTKHLKIHESMKFKCDYCPQVFMKQSMLLTHLSLTHKNEQKMYKCKIDGCQREFICKLYLDTHMAKTHLDKLDSPNMLYCFPCKKEFSALWLKNQHDEIKHKGNQLYKCLYDNCGKTFSSSSKLHRHSLIHLKDKKYKCQVNNCTAEFNRKEHLISHINVHSDGKPFYCDHAGCKATFRYYNNLLTHKKFHSKPLQISNCSGDLTPITNGDMINSNNQFEQLIELIEPDSNNNKILSLDDNDDDDDDDEKDNFDIKLANEKLDNYLKKVSSEKLDGKPMVKRPRLQSLNVCNTQNDFDFNLTVSPSPESLPPTNYTEFIQQPPPLNELEVFLEEPCLEQVDQEHVININSDDEEYTTCTVVLENLFGSARTDYKSNHVYIEKYRSKRKNQKIKFSNVKRVKSVDCDEISSMSSSTPSSSISSLVTTPSSSRTNTSLDSIKSTLKQALTSKQLKNSRPLSNSISLDLDFNTQNNNNNINTTYKTAYPQHEHHHHHHHHHENTLIDDGCFIDCLDF
ncbi:unnamed protein product [Brachionus calyciflorus]|uniref:C2H2-type domain-containing protein n=1 Tax=Brachionus calyciflorus TaxID=104777 RepID=A0A813PWD1_9BILA|nr:unnamed protein product [Brachionus calyciflorus]